MNVGIITTWFDRGAAYVSKAYMDILSGEHKVFIYARGGEQYAKGDSNWDLANVTWGSPVLGQSPMYIDWKEFKTWIGNNNIEILLFNEQQDWDVILRAQKLDIPIGAYVDYYTSDTFQYYWLYDFLLCNTKRHFSVFKSHHQAFYIPWGTDLQVFQPQTKAGLQKTITFFHSCGFSPNRKGTELLLNAFSRISGEAKLIIHSQRPLEDNFPEITKLIKADARICLIEKVVSPPGLYHLGHIYAYPTVLEGIGLTIAEALACGLPVITTDEPPMNEFIVDGANGKLVDVAYYETRNDNYYWKQSYCDLDSLTQAMKFYVDRVDDLGQFKEEARLYALNNLDWSKNSLGLPQLINEIRVIHKKSDRALVKKVQIYERERKRHYSSTYIMGVKKIIKRSVFYPLALFIWHLWNKKN